MATARRCSQLLAGVLALGLPAVGFAQTAAEKAATAEALFNEGKKLIADGMLAQACVKFAASQSLDPALGTLLNLADCHERIGKTASAWAEFLNAKSEALRLGQSERASVAAARATAIEPRLTRLVVSVPTQARVDGLEVLRDTIVLDTGVWDSPMPVDPGAHTTTARAPARVTWTQTVEVVGEGRTYTVTVPKLDPASPESLPSAAAAGPSPPPVASQTTQQPAPSTVASASSSPQHNANLQRPAGLIVGAAGLVAIGVGSYFGLAARSKWNDADCPNNVCPTTDRQKMAEESKKQANLSTGLFVGGGVLLAAGAVLFLTSPAATTPYGGSTPGRAGSRFALVPAVDTQAASLSLHGRF
jgi:hypothetical protein